MPEHVDPKDEIRKENPNDRHPEGCRSYLAERVGFEPTDPGGSMP
jgi:hypothetical protein